MFFSRSNALIAHLLYCPFYRLYALMGLQWLINLQPWNRELFWPSGGRKIAQKVASVRNIYRDPFLDEISAFHLRGSHHKINEFWYQIMNAWDLGSASCVHGHTHEGNHFWWVTLKNCEAESFIYETREREKTWCGVSESKIIGRQKIKGMKKHAIVKNSGIFHIFLSHSHSFARLVLYSSDFLMIEKFFSIIIMIVGSISSRMFVAVIIFSLSLVLYETLINYYRFLIIHGCEW